MGLCKTMTQAKLDVSSPLLIPFPQSLPAGPHAQELRAPNCAVTMETSTVPPIPERLRGLLFSCFSFFIKTCLSFSSHSHALTLVRDINYSPRGPLHFTGTFYRQRDYRQMAEMRGPGATRAHEDVF